MGVFVTSFLIFSIIGIVGSILANKIIKDNGDELVINLNEEHIIIHLPIVYKWVGLICSLFFILLFVLMLIFPNDTAEN